MPPRVHQPKPSPSDTPTTATFTFSGMVLVPLPLFEKMALAYYSRPYTPQAVQPSQWKAADIPQHTEQGSGVEEITEIDPDTLDDFTRALATAPTLRRVTRPPPDVEEDAE